MRPRIPEHAVLTHLSGASSTPVYLYDKVIVADRCQILSDLSCCSPRFKPYYMAKANWAPPIIEEVQRGGLGIVVSSDLELSLALTAGFEGERIIAIGPAKSVSFLRICVDSHVGLIIVESVEEARDLSRLVSREVSVGLRIQLDISAHRPQSLIRLGCGFNSKFGVPSDNLVETAREIGRLRNLKLIALSTNLGSQICDPQVFETCVDKMAERALGLRRLGFPIMSVDIGGGLPVRSFARRFSRAMGRITLGLIDRDMLTFFEEPSEACNPQKLVPRLLSRLDGSGLDLLMEPGRWIVADCMSLIVEVVRAVERRDGVWLYVDGGIDLLPDAGRNQRRPFTSVARATPNGQFAPYTVAGPLCMKGDILTSSVTMEGGLRDGDFLLIGAAGAYGFSRVSWFGGRLPSIVEFADDGQTLRLVWAAPSIDELWGLSRSYSTSETHTLQV